MKKRDLLFRKGLLVATPLMLGLVLASCSDDDSPTPSTTDGGQYVIAAASGEATYLLQTDTIETGTLSIVGNGVESDAATHWLFPANKYAYGLKYQQGSAGIVKSFVLDESGLLTQRTAEFETPRFTGFGCYDKYLMLGAAAATSEYASTDIDKKYPKYGIIYSVIDAEISSISQYTFVTENLTGNGEYYTVSGFVGTNDKIYTSLCPVGVSSYGVSQGVVAEANKNLISSSNTISGTLEPNVARIAVFNGISSFGSKPTIVETNRISYATSRFQSQYYPTICLADDGYLYVFSNSYAKSATDPRQKTTLDAGVVRLDTKTDKFDDNYYYSIESASGGYTFFQVWYVSGSKFLMRMYDKPGAIGSGNANTTYMSYGVFDGKTGTFTKVTGLPDAAAFGTSGSIGRFAHIEDGKAYIAVTTADGNQPAVYIIDVDKATATKGITIVADGGISAIGKLYR